MLGIGFAQAQQPKEIIARVNQQFSKVLDYTADIQINFRIPGVNMEPAKGKVFYKAPDKFRVKTSGILFLPRQNPYQSLSLLRDTNAYMAVSGGSEKVGAIMCQVINVIPSKDGDLILGKFWIHHEKGLVLKSQLTTRSNGTILVENNYGSQERFALPDQMVFTIDMTKFKVPKTVAVDLNSKSKVTKSGSDKESGSIELLFSRYALNQKIKDEVFKK